MRIVVVGATGRTGRQVVTTAADAGHDVLAFSRSAAAQAWPEGVSARSGSVLDADACKAALEGADAVIVCISMVRTSDFPWARITTPKDLHTRAATVLTAASVAQGVDRYVTISAHGVGDSWRRAGPLFLTLVHTSNIGVAYRNLAHAEKIVLASGLSATVIRPTRLTDGTATGDLQVGTQLRTTSFASISRADVARFLVEVAVSGAHAGKCASVSNR